MDVLSLALETKRHWQMWGGKARVRYSQMEVEEVEGAWKEAV